jgi:hypothetical protein
MSVNNSTKEINQNKNLERKNYLTLTVLKYDSNFFHVKIGTFSTIGGMTKAEILAAEKKYKGNFEIIFANTQIKKKFDDHIDDPLYS